MTEHEENLRDLAALFALTGLLARNTTGVGVVIPAAFDLADEFMQIRKRAVAPEDGIAAIKPNRKKPNE